MVKVFFEMRNCSLIWYGGSTTKELHYYLIHTHMVRSKAHNTKITNKEHTLEHGFWDLVTSHDVDPHIILFGNKNNFMF
jgi:hypothetical protein